MLGTAATELATEFTFQFILYLSPKHILVGGE
jgi:hypothetical protein